MILEARPQWRNPASRLVSPKELKGQLRGCLAEEAEKKKMLRHEAEADEGREDGEEQGREGVGDRERGEDQGRGGSGDRDQVEGIEGKEDERKEEWEVVEDEEEKRKECE